MSFTTLRSLLHGHLQAFAQAQTPALGVAWENRTFGPPQQTPYLQAHVLLAPPRAAGLGREADDYQRGVYQVDVVGLPGVGWGAVEALVDGLREHFGRGVKLAGAGVEATMEAVARGPELQDGTRCKVPVSITFYAYMAPA